MNQNLIANAKFKFLILNCRGGEMNLTSNTRWNSTKREYVLKVLMWH